MDTSYRARTPALVVIDVQVGVIADCWDAPAVVRRIDDLVQRARHDGVPVIWVQDERVGRGPGSEPWQLAAPLSAASGEPVVAKRWRDAFADTTLEAELVRVDVGRLVIAGAQSDFCVRTTAQRAAGLGYDVTLVSDAHTTEDSVLGDVTVSAEQIVAHSNMYFSTLAYPGQQCTVSVAADVTW